jgi:pimeloyl-ACP methyl ester carboxylesterase
VADLPFLPVVPALLVRYHTYALDLCGHGLSSRAPGAYFISKDAEAVIAFLRNSVSEPAVLLGHSLGAIVSILVAAEAPQLVRPVVLEDPPLAELSDDKASIARAHQYFRALRDMMIKETPMGDQRVELTSIQPQSNAVQIRARLKTRTQCDPEMLTLIIENRKVDLIRCERADTRTASA